MIFPSTLPRLCPFLYVYFCASLCGFTEREGSTAPNRREISAQNREAAVGRFVLLTPTATRLFIECPQTYLYTRHFFSLVLSYDLYKYIFSMYIILMVHNIFVPKFPDLVNLFFLKSQGDLFLRSSPKLPFHTLWILSFFVYTIINTLSPKHYKQLSHFFVPCSSTLHQ